ncbi:hypothetical protein PMM47T1_21213 [Pseudomonas sp. M47T1]|nr:hypothetical protein PMM47T1_21213 [Pseudomonas sp. M47T1]
MGGLLHPGVLHVADSMGQGYSPAPLPEQSLLSIVAMDFFDMAAAKVRVAAARLRWPERTLGFFGEAQGQRILRQRQVGAGPRAPSLKGGASGPGDPCQKTDIGVIIHHMDFIERAANHRLTQGRQGDWRVHPVSDTPLRQLFRHQQVTLAAM